MWLLAAALLGDGFAAQAQWLTQSIGLSNGWNVVFLHVDASHTNLAGLVTGEVGNPIMEVWRWNPASVAQFSDSPTLPSAAVEWSTKLVWFPRAYWTRYWPTWSMVAAPTQRPALEPALADIAPPMATPSCFSVSITALTMPPMSSLPAASPRYIQAI